MCGQSELALRQGFRQKGNRYKKRAYREYSPELRPSVYAKLSGPKGLVLARRDERQTGQGPKKPKKNLRKFKLSISPNSN